MESRRLSRQRARPLRRVPQPAQHLRRHHQGKRFAGGPNPEGKGWVPNITQKGIADWSVKDIAYLLESGMTPDGDSVGSSMTDVVENTALISAADRLAIATYIKSLPPVEGPPKPRRSEAGAAARSALLLFCRRDRVAALHRPFVAVVGAAAETAVRRRRGIFV